MADIIDDTTKEIKDVINSTKKKETPVEFITSGSTILNLALSGKGKNGGWARGRIVNIVADGSAGKSLAALEASARFFYGMEENESINFPKVKEVQVVYNNVETVMDFPVSAMYGDDFYDNIEWINIPFIEKTGRDFSRRVLNLKEGTSLLYVIDSWDALKTEKNYDIFIESANKDKKGKDGYNLGKQQYGTQLFFPSICTAMEGKDATLMIISQTRDKIGVTFGAKQTRTGGKALDFYTHQVCWFRQVEKMKKIVKGRELIYGVKVEADVKRSKVALPYRKAMFTILFNYGIDDISSMLDWYFGPKKKLTEEDLSCFSIPYEGKTDRASIIEFIESNSLEEELQDLVEKEWQKQEEKIKPKRKSKF